MAIKTKALTAFGAVALAGGLVTSAQARETRIPLDRVPAVVMTAAKTQLSAISIAEQVTRRGKLFYDVRGKRSSDGKTVELRISSDGKVLGLEP